MRRVFFALLVLAALFLFSGCSDRSQVSTSTTRLRSPDSMSDPAMHDGPYTEHSAYVLCDPP